MLVLLLCLVRMVSAQELSPGKVIDDVKCLADSSQSYSLYLPSSYRGDRPWPVIFAFDPRARGKTAVERYAPGAEKYGYIVAGSNNSRNGSWEVSAKAAQAMLADVDQRFPMDVKRLFTAGMSGGARVAMQVALGTKQFAGVIASSAGYPDSQPRKSVPFLVFGTAGTEDFNYSEMRDLGRELKTPHKVSIFEGGHVWLPVELATEAIEWMEIQSMKRELRSRDEARIDAILAAGVSRIEALKNDKDRAVELEALAAEFAGLRDVTAYVARAGELRKQKVVKDVLRKEQDADQKERVWLGEIFELERGASWGQLSARLNKLAKVAGLAEDSPDRRVARRVIRGVVAGSADRSRDPEYRKIIDGLRRTLPRT